MCSCNCRCTDAPYITPLANEEVCANNAVLAITATDNSIASGYQWSSSGSGTFSDPTSQITSYTPSDADTAAGSVVLNISTTAHNGACNSINEGFTLNISNAPFIDAGAGVAVCANNANVPLMASVNSVTATYQWSTSGSGTFDTPNALTANYTPSDADTTGNPAIITLNISTTAQGNCNSVNDDIAITITDAPTVDPGSNVTVCADNPSTVLAGASTNAGGISWSYPGTDGGFALTTDPTTTFTAGPLDTAAGSAVLTLSTTGSTGCLEVSDNITVTINGGIYVDAGDPQIVCADSPNIVLNGNVWGLTTSSGSWSSDGSGTFMPNPTTLNATYMPSPADTVDGSIILTLTSTNNGDCNAVSDNMTLTINPGIYVNPGAGSTVCANNANIALSGGVFFGANTGSWSSSGDGTFSPNINDLSATYLPSVTDTGNGNVTLTLTSTGNGACMAVSESIIITITDAPYITPLANEEVCANNAVLAITATDNSIASAYQWSSSGSGTFSDPTSQITSYTPSDADTAAGSVVLNISTTAHNGACNSINEGFTLNISNAPFIDAGAGVAVCANNANVPLMASVNSVTATYQWSTSGSGTFDTPNALTANYTPSDADTTGNPAIITLNISTTAQGNCNSVNDDIAITITDAPTVDPGSNVTVCADNPSTVLAGASTNAGGISWSYPGTDGGFALTTDPTTTFTAGPLDTAAGSAVLTLSTTGSTGCLEVSDNITVTINGGIYVDAGDPQIVCADSPNIVLNGNVWGLTTSSGSWSSDGSGTFMPNPTTLNATYMPSPADTVDGSIILTLTSTNNGDCNAVSDNMTLTINPGIYVNPGAGSTVCANNANIALSGGVFFGANTGSWSSSGDGTFSPNINDLSATYLPSVTDTGNGNVTLTLTSTGNGACMAVSESIIITITDAPYITPLANEEVCANNAVLAITATDNSIASGYQWSSSGSGTFSDPTSQITSYTPSDADTAAGSVVLNISTTAHSGACNSINEGFTLNISNAPFIDAGAGVAVCANNANVPLMASVNSVTATYQWSSSGSGTFDTPNALAANYSPSDADTTGNPAIITLNISTTAQGNCNSVNDDIAITITDAPDAQAGGDLIICADSAYIQLNGTSNVGTYSWSTFGFGTFDDINSLSAKYDPADADTSAGLVKLVLTATGGPGCSTDRDTISITITDAPTIEAGPNKTVCATNPNTALTGTANSAAGIITWSTSGTGSFSPNVNDLNATYIPSDADTSAGLVMIRLATAAGGPCKQLTDSFALSITSGITVLAGDDQTVCANAPDISLVGSVPSVGLWSTNGSGTFLPDVNTMNATYLASPGDTSLGSIKIYLETVDHGSCAQAFDTLDVTINPGIYINAGNNLTLCADTSFVQLAGNVWGDPAYSGSWSTLSNGTFDDDQNLNAKYTPSSADTANGSVVLTLTSTGVGLCNPITDNVTITFSNAPTIDAGVVAPVCANNREVNLLGASTVATAWQWSTLVGSGTFSSTGLLNSVYTPSDADTLAGSATLTLSTTAQGDCKPVSDIVIITITDAPFIEAGLNDTICANNPIATLNAQSIAASSVLWTSTGSGTFGNDTDLSTSYLASPADTTTNSIKLYITSQNNGTCNAVLDSLSVVIEPGIFVEAGSAINACSQVTSVQLNGG